MENLPINNDNTQDEKAKKKLAYCKNVDNLEKASVYGKHYHPVPDGSRFHPRSDIDWGNPEYEMIENDERWILPSNIPIGNHEWYQSQSTDEQIRIGKLYISNVILTGAQFENLLIKGILTENMEKSVSDPDSIYPLLEAGEEVNHKIMFRELIRHMGVETKGAPAWFRRFVPLLATTIPNKIPAGFWTFVYAGEEPIDQLQKTLRDQGANLHPLLTTVMDIHIAEEARHITYAKKRQEKYLEPGSMNTLQRMGYKALFPVMMRVAANVILRPSREVLKEMGIPKEVSKEMFWDSQSGKESLSNLFPDTRKFADKNKLREGKIFNFIWKRLGLNENLPVDTDIS